MRSSIHPHWRLLLPCPLRVTERSQLGQISRSCVSPKISIVKLERAICISHIIPLSRSVVLRGSGWRWHSAYCFAAPYAPQGLETPRIRSCWYQSITGIPVKPYVRTNIILFPYHKFVGLTTRQGTRSLQGRAAYLRLRNQGSLRRSYRDLGFLYDGIECIFG